MVNKRAQMKIQQMAFMLMAITLFFVLMGMFVLIFKMSGLKEEATELQEQNALLLVTKIANSPEFSCGNGFGGERINCIDGDKLMMLRENINRYEEFWEVENIEVRKVDSLEEELCTVSNYPNCNTIRLRDQEISGFDLSNFVSLCRKANFDGEVYDKCELARVSISYENVE